jgi:putative salt-induced outer membrane protein YdiY
MAQDAAEAEVTEGAVPKVGDPSKEASTPPADVMAPPMMTSVRVPPAYDRRKYDWIRLTSGEWLKGDVLSMRNDKFEFDSDEMGEQTFDWDDIAELRSSRKYTYVFNNRTSLIGTALILDNEVVLSVNGEERVLKRADLMSIVPAGMRERERWDGKLSIGLAFRRGNTDQTDFTYQAYVRRRDAITRVRLDFNGAIGEVEQVETVNNYMSTFKFDLFLSPRFYVTPLGVICYHDKFQNIDVQVTPAAGGGFHALKKKRAEIDLELAGGYQYTKYISVEADADQENRTGAVIPRMRIETDPLKDVDLDLLYQAAITVPDPEDTTMHGEVILSIEITKVFDLDVSWIWDRVQTPKPEEDGTVPKKDDVKLTVGIGLDF